MTEAFKQLQQRAQTQWDALHQRPWVRITTGILAGAAGAEEVVAAFRQELARTGVDATVSEVGTTGLCYAEPIVDIITPGGPRVLYGNVTPDLVPDLIARHVKDGQPIADRALATVDSDLPGVPRREELPMMRKQLRIALRNAGEIDPIELNQYIARGGYEGLDKALSEMTSAEVLQEVKDSGLRGRGGAAFPTGVKWGFLAGNPSPIKYILCNCEEGDPGAFNDKGILESDPFTLIEGLTMAGYATGASNGIVFIRHGHSEPIDRTQAAIKACYEAGLLGKNIMGTDFSFEVEVSLVGESYVAGEETALMEAVEGKRSMPRFRPPFPAAYGVWGKPSNINNVKTLSYAPEIIRRGADWFKSTGTEKSPGTAIACLSGHAKYRGLAEIPFGLTMREVVEEIGGGDRDGGAIKLLQTGGPLGGLLPADQLDMVLDFDGMVKAGAMFGSGGLIVVNETACAVDLVRNLVAFDQLESCGKCFPCRLGTSHLLEVLERIATFASRPGDLELLHRIGASMKAGSLCGHGQLGFNPINSALTAFAEEFRQHMEEGYCATGRCGQPFVGRNTARRWAHLAGVSPTATVKADFVNKLAPVGEQA
jgi:NADH:ubiquinone oxidoreductase subunit F (NADH-binding)/(2Fe-2S) ferredoxin